MQKDTRKTKSTNTQPQFWVQKKEESQMATSFYFPETVISMCRLPPYGRQPPTQVLFFS